jgi:hypothetical protein
MWEKTADKKKIVSFAFNDVNMFYKIAMHFQADNNFPLVPSDGILIALKYPRVVALGERATFSGW